MNGVVFSKQELFFHGHQRKICFWPHLRLRQLAKKASPWSVVIISESSSASKTSKLTQLAPITANSWSVQQFDSFKWVRLVRLPTKAWNWGTRDICLKESKNKPSSSWHKKEIGISEQVWPLKHFLFAFCIKRSSICLEAEGKSIIPYPRGNFSLSSFQQFQQFSPLGFGPLKGFLSW